jgi:hypothetical protein
VPQHDFFHLCRIRRASGQHGRNLAKIAWTQHAGPQNAQSARRFLPVVGKAVNDPAFDEDGLPRLEHDVLTIDAPVSP